MTIEPTISAGRYMTLRDYLRVLRRNWIMIAVIAIVGAAAGFAAVAREKSVYQASAEVSFQDPTQALNVVGLGGSNGNQTPAQLAAVNAETATGNAVISQVKRQLKTSDSTTALTNALATQVSTQSGLLQITASGPSPGFATRLANAAAGVLVAQDNQHTRTQFAQVASDIRRRISSLPAFQRSASPASPLTFYENELARVDTLGQFATSAQVAKLAQPPSGPSSPQRSRSVLLGLALGLLLGIVAAFFRDSLDRRLRSPQDVDSSFRLPLLGYVGKRSMGRMAYMTNGRGKQQLDLEQFKILRRNLEVLDHQRPPRSILVTSTVPGEGKTTVASSLALAMAAAGKRTLLVDCDLRRPTLAGRLGLEASPGISEYLAGNASPEEILRTFEFAEPPRASDPAAVSSNGHGTATGVHKLVCIPSGSSTSRAAELLGSNRFKDFIEQVSTTYDAIVLDSSPLLPVADTLEMLPHVDAIVICARESRTTRGQASAARATLSRFPERPTGVVVTGVRPRGAGDEIYAYSYGYS
jgi:Mrp family chromosome partitioning ATPase/capsular polysaccharide biosynthesis protein